MLKKAYRLPEREVKRVLRGRKPFFSAEKLSLIAMPSRLPHGRFTLVIGSKNVTDGVTRNFFRRRLYDRVAAIRDAVREDMVFLVKRGIVLSRRDVLMIEAFDTDVRTLLERTRIPVKRPVNPYPYKKPLPPQS